MHMINEKIQKQYTELPLFLFGHSMGSFLTRRYIQLYKNISGVILSDTGGSQGLIGKAGKLIAAIEARRIGGQTASKLMNTLTFCDFNKAFQPARTAFDFRTRDEQAVDLYIKDKYCGFICSAKFYKDLLYGIEIIHRPKKVAHINHDLPIYSIAGTNDPLGYHGKVVKQDYEQYLAAR